MARQKATRGRTSSPTFELVIPGDKGFEKYPGLSLAEAHARLGSYAGQNGCMLHVHEGEWTESSYSVAYVGDDPLLGVKALVRTST